MRMVHLVVEFLLLFYCYPTCIYSSRDEPANVNTASTVCSKREQGLDAYLVPQFTLALMVVAHSFHPHLMMFLSFVSTLTLFLRVDTLCHIVPKQLPWKMKHFWKKETW